MTAKIIDGRKIAEKIRENIKKEVNKLRIVPNITTIKIGDDPQSNLYLKLRNKACHEVGIKSTVLELQKDTTEKGIIDSIKQLNNDKNVHGIMVQFPLPEHINSEKIIKEIDHRKDVEGLTPYNMGETLSGDEQIIPITPLSVLTILEHEKTQLKGKNIVVVNHSNIVGKPLSVLLLNRNATVSICHVYTKDLKDYSSKAEIIVSAAGVPNLITKDHVKKNAFIIDVGIVKTKDGICGDVDFDSLKETAGKITPVPGGVGPVTVACSLINMLKTYQLCFE
jgi:methylenetetrahydrofolate dehydrogenase (NADP+)/methenyltetrahydrofolate cyclohydrolase